MESLRDAARVLLAMAGALAAAVLSAVWDAAAYWLGAALARAARLPGGGWERRRQRRLWQARLEDATTYCAWEEAARALDALDGCDAWRRGGPRVGWLAGMLGRGFPFLDADLVASRTAQLHRACELEDAAAVAFLLRTSLARDFAGAGNARLFGTGCRVGTLSVVEAFHAQVLEAVRFLATEPGALATASGVAARMRLLRELRHALGNTALLLSGGASLGMYHVGVLHALHETGLVPRIVCGASSGSIMAAIACTRPDAEWPAMLRLEGINCTFLTERERDVSGSVCASGDQSPSMSAVSPREGSDSDIDRHGGRCDADGGHVEDLKLDGESSRSTGSPSGKENAQPVSAQKGEEGNGSGMPPDSQASTTQGLQTGSVSNSKVDKARINHVEQQHRGAKTRPRVEWMRDALRVAETWRRKIARLAREGVVFDSDVLRASLRESIGDVTFLEAYERTARVLNVAVSSPSMYDMPCLLNYITAPHVLVWSAVVASCALPALFASAPLLARDDAGRVVPWEITGGDRWIDGSVDNDLPLRRLAELFNVGHTVVSQVNPHIYPFLRRHALDAGRDAAGRRLSRWAWPTRLASALLSLVRSEASHRLAQLGALGFFPRACVALRSVLSQTYHGDVTIVPEISWGDLAHVFADRPRSCMAAAVLAGARATWPKVGLLRARTAAELAIDSALLDLRARLGALSGGERPDVMLDPEVNVARHVSPAVGVRSSPSLAELAGGLRSRLRSFSRSGDLPRTASDCNEGADST